MVQRGDKKEEMRNQVKMLQQGNNEDKIGDKMVMVQEEDIKKLGGMMFQLKKTTTQCITRTKKRNTCT
jgi:hypothetical protein